ncbi:polysaccharide deacetylase family protein [Paenibacillus sp. NPDC058071]|uniref:polysaccharide deacetylase family protein n=1 Tax=Paenibacillus sp. NPDC058071 TaxID=3346326 RepID=UPI0036D781CD
MSQDSGLFVISIDFELYWGVRDLYSLEEYRRRFGRERSLIPDTLALFARNGIHATWATVGLLFFESKGEMLASLPIDKPGYVDDGLSPYDHLASSGIGDAEADDPDHFAPSLIRLIQETPYQSISTHTFSHYYCQEEGQTEEQFQADLEAAAAIADKRGLRLESIVFPRNQMNERYLQVLRRLNIGVYRGNPSHWLYRRGYSTGDPPLRRALRLADTYFNLSGYHCYPLQSYGETEPINIPASQFLRSYSTALKHLEPLRIKRIKDAMTYAAKRGQVYHLWWHPYNLAEGGSANMAVLEQIVEHFGKLRDRYGMRSANMEEAASLAFKQAGH